LILEFQKAIELRNWNAKKRLKDEILTRENTAQDDAFGVRWDPHALK